MPEPFRANASSALKYLALACFAAAIIAPTLAFAGTLGPRGDGSAYMFRLVIPIFLVAPFVLTGVLFGTASFFLAKPGARQGTRGTLLLNGGLFLLCAVYYLILYFLG